MTIFEITDIKNFMEKLLGTSMFDHFLLMEATISSGVTYSIDGRLNRDFYTEEELEQLSIQPEAVFSPFSLLRQNCFALIRGKTVPTYFKFVFMLSPANLKNTIQYSSSAYTEEDISAMFLNLTFQNGKLNCTTGISYRIFSVDKTLDQEWDTLIRKFLLKNKVEFE